MTKATTRRWFFIGTAVFTLAFIALTIHTHTTIARRTHGGTRALAGPCSPVWPWPSPMGGRIVGHRGGDLIQAG